MVVTFQKLYTICTLTVKFHLFRMYPIQSLGILQNYVRFYSVRKMTNLAKSCHKYGIPRSFISPVGFPFGNQVRVAILARLLNLPFAWVIFIEKFLSWKYSRGSWIRFSENFYFPARLHILCKKIYAAQLEGNDKPTKYLVKNKAALTTTAACAKASSVLK